MFFKLTYAFSTYKLVAKDGINTIISFWILLTSKTRRRKERKKNKPAVSNLLTRKIRFDFITGDHFNTLFIDDKIA